MWVHTTLQSGVTPIFTRFWGLFAISFWKVLTAASGIPGRGLPNGDRRIAFQQRRVVMSRPIGWPIELTAAATLLLRAAALAEESQSPLWDFAVEISDLFAQGVTRVDLRWLKCRGLVENLDEFSYGAAQHRQFRSTGSLTFSDSTCFVLTTLGLQAARLLLANCRAKKGETIADSSLELHPACYEEFVSVDSELSELKPVWNADIFRLSIGHLVVKEFRGPAKNQQRILAAFQEEDWPLRIDDPLPPIAKLEPVRRLHDTVAALNRHQRNRLLRFSADGVGRGVKWTIMRESGRYRG
jgi:hypothetical protein